MRIVLMILFLSLAALQCKLWMGDGNLLQWKALQGELASHQEENAKLIARNQGLEADIIELKRGDQALEEQARSELGMIKQSEEYYHFIN